MKGKLIIVIFICLVGLSFRNTSPRFYWRNFGGVSNFFESSDSLLKFFDFHKGDVVAEVGACRGINVGGFSILTDSISFYIQDIDSVNLTIKHFNKILKKCKKYKTPITNTFHLCLGTDTSTNLPDNTFDKIILVVTFHVIDHPNEMLKDIYKKLKPEGLLYILDAECFTKGHHNYNVDKVVSMVNNYHFHLIHKEIKNLHYASGMYRAVFRKVKQSN